MYYIALFCALYCIVLLQLRQAGHTATACRKPEAVRSWKSNVRSWKSSAICHSFAWLSVVTITMVLQHKNSKAPQNVHIMRVLLYFVLTG